MTTTQPIRDLTRRGDVGIMASAETHGSRGFLFSPVLVHNRIACGQSPAIMSGEIPRRVSQQHRAYGRGTLLSRRG